MTTPSLEELDRSLLARLDEFGISRLADTSGLDRIEVPTASCVKPGTLDGIWVYSGKGSTHPEARVTAIIECIERTSALWDEARLVFGPPSGAECWPLTRFTERTVGETTAWIEGEHLRTGKSVWLPAMLAFSGRRPSTVHIPEYGCVTTNGLGAGLTEEAAIARGLAEVIERDVVSVAELRASHFGAAFLAAIASAFGLGAGELDSFRDDSTFVKAVDIETLPNSARDIALRFRQAGLDVQLKFIPNTFGVPVFGAAAIETMWGSVLATAGYAASTNPEEAARKALLELAQSRATDRQGAREDCLSVDKKRLDKVPRHHWLASASERVSYNDLDLAPLTGNAVDSLLTALDAGGLHDAAFVRFPTFVGLHVVRVMVPEIETWHPTGGESRLGVRARGMFDA